MARESAIRKNKMRRIVSSKLYWSTVIVGTSAGLGLQYLYEESKKPGEAHFVRSGYYVTARKSEEGINYHACRYVPLDKDARGGTEIASDNAWTHASHLSRVDRGILGKLDENDRVCGLHVGIELPGREKSGIQVDVQDEVRSTDYYQGPPTDWHNSFERWEQAWK